VLIFDDQDAGRCGRAVREGERGDGAAAGVVLQAEGGAQGDGGLVGDGQAEPEPVGGAGAAAGEQLDRLGGGQAQARPGVGAATVTPAPSAAACRVICPLAVYFAAFWAKLSKIRSSRPALAVTVSSAGASTVTRTPGTG
jgi:hypothetical protein